MYDSTQPWPKGRDGVRARVEFLSVGTELVVDEAARRRRATLASALVAVGVLLLVLSSLASAPRLVGLLAGVVPAAVGLWMLTIRPVRRRAVLEPAEMIFYDDCLIVYTPSRNVVLGAEQARVRTFEYVARRNVEGLVVDSARHVVEVAGPTSVASVAIVGDGVDDATFVASYNSRKHPMRIHVRGVDERRVVEVLRDRLGTEILRA